MLITKSPNSWKSLLEKPFHERLTETPEELVSHVAVVNSSCGNLCNPKLAAAPKDFILDARQALEELPAVVKKKLEDTLLGIYFGTGWGSSALTDMIANERGEMIGIAIAVDIEMLLTSSANKWATYKENSPFLGGEFNVNAMIENASNDNRKNAIQYLLLHEFGHVLSAKKNFLPDWWLKPENFKSTDEYSFLPISWQINMSNEIIPLMKENFQHRKEVQYYSDKKLPNHYLTEVYSNLNQTSFVSLYAATNAHEDLAEMFAFYVHTELLKKPYQVQLRHKDALVVDLTSYKSNKRFKQKYQFFEDYLKN